MKDHKSPGDSLIPLCEAPNFLPKRRGKKVHYSTVYRWATKGARGRILRSELVGGVRYTSLESLREFFTGISAPTTDSSHAAELRRVLYGKNAP